ncbi:MAG: phosphoribosylanthranilate isomerase [Gemmatimonadaceae bacterium]
MTRIKFCGITRPQDAAVAGEAGASHIGVILTESPRRIPTERASEIFAASPDLRRVGVFRHGPVNELLHDASVAGVEILQLHGNFSEGELAELRGSFGGELWAVVPVDTAQPGGTGVWESLAEKVDAILLDTSIGGASGGTGVPFDWHAARSLAASIAARSQLIVAGGLDPGNVAGAVRILAPGMVDVSSGVESAPGIKDPALMKAFAKAVRSASIV